MKKTRNVVSAKRRLQPGKASNYIGHFESEIRPGDNVLLWCRESHPQNAAHLDHDEAALRDSATKRAANVVGVHRCVAVGYDGSHQSRGCWVAELARAAALAKKHGAKLLAAETDRLVRHPAFHPKLNPTAQARESDLADLVSWTDGVPLLTLLHPDASSGVARSSQTKRGRKAVGRYGGRPPKRQPGYKKKRRLDLLPRILELYSHGMRLGQIVVETRVPRRTISRWLSNPD
jgi:hypothetical protein